VQFLILHQVEASATLTIVRREESKTVFRAVAPATGDAPDRGWDFTIPSEASVQAAIERRAKHEARRKLVPALARALEKSWRWDR
jgi:hypothetical protein